MLSGFAGRDRAKEGQELKWYGARLTDYPMPPADILLIAIIRDLL